MRKSREKANLIKIICLAVITIISLAGCSSNDLKKMLESGESIEIIVAEPDYASTVEHGTEQILDWQPLGYRTNNLDFRLSVDEVLNITQSDTGKTGVLYINTDGVNTNNSTMYNAFMNQAFIDNYWNNEEVKSQLESFSSTLYGGESSDTRAAAFVNGYWNLFSDNLGEQTYFNGSTTVTRAEFLSAVYKSYNPVQEDLSMNEDLVYYVGADDVNVKYVSQMLDKSYLNTDDFSLNDRTYDSTITKAEALFTIVKTFYSEEFDKTTGNEELILFENGGDMATKQGFISKDKEKPNCWKAAELSYAIENGALPNDLYRAMVVANKHGLLDDMMAESTVLEWSDGITKAESLRLIIDVFETLGEENGYAINLETGAADSEEAERLEAENEAMKKLYESLSCLKHVTYIDGDYAYTSEWKDAMISNFAYFEDAPDHVINDFLRDFAEEGYNNYDGEKVYEKMIELTKNGYLYITPDAEVPSNTGSDKEQNNTNSNTNNNSDNGSDDVGSTADADQAAADALFSDLGGVIPEDDGYVARPEDQNWGELDPTWEWDVGAD